MTKRMLDAARQMREPALLALSGFMLMMSLAAIGAGNETARAALEADALAEAALHEQVSPGDALAAEGLMR